MENNNREFGLFIDSLRLDRNVSREDLCEGIISLSQYKRYLRGVSSIPNNILVLLADRLKLSISDLHTLFSKRYDTQYNKIMEVYTLMHQNNFNSAYQKAQDLKSDILISEYNKLFFDFCLLQIQYNLNMVSKIHLLDIYSKMIDYPACIDNDSFNLIEMNIMLEIVNISSGMENYEPSEFLYTILASKTKSFLVSGDTGFMPVVYTTLSQVLGNQGLEEKVAEITGKGIEYCIKYSTTSGLPRLFLFNSFANFNLGQKDLALQSAKKAFMVLHIENKPEKMLFYKKAFENKFNMKLDELIRF